MQKLKNTRIKKVLYLLKSNDFKQIVEGFANLEYYNTTALTKGKHCAALAWKTWRADSWHSSSK